jgi:hypothetical protein
MTLGIGMRPSREAGVLLIADSLEPYIGANHALSFGLDGKKLLFLAGTDTAVVISGNVSDAELWANGIVFDHQPLMPGLPQEPDPRARVRRAFPVIQRIDAAVRASHPGMDRYGELDDPGPHALFATSSLLAKFTSKTETWAEPGDVYAIGGWLLGMPSDIAVEMQLPAPDTLAECKALATDWVCRYIDQVFDGYRDPFAMMRETREAPGIGGPLQLLTLQPGHTTRLGDRAGAGYSLTREVIAVTKEA